MWGLGKKRSKLGRWLDSHGLYQKDLQKESKINRTTLSRICNDPHYIPSQSTIKRLLVAIRKIDPNKKMSDFWDM